MTYNNSKIRPVSLSALVLTLAGIVTAAVILFAATVTAATGGILGDADGDGQVSINDVTAIQRTLAELPINGEFSEMAADVDGSGGIAITDATLIQWWLAEMETPYPIGTQFEIPTVTTAAPTERQTDADGWGRDVFRP